MQHTLKFLALFLGLTLGVAHAKVELPALVSDNMILQRDIPIPVWGWANPGEQVEVGFMGKTYTTTTGSDGKWQTKLDPTHAGGPYQMTVKASNEITLDNILVGDVWLCSGQSNMDMRLKAIPVRYDAEIAHSSNAKIRYFDVQNYNGLSGPVEKLKGSWTLAAPETVPGFSAVAYFFGQALQAKYNIPVGLIVSSVSGSHIEAWISEESLKSFPEYYKVIHRYDDPNTVKEINQREKAAIDQWYKQVEAGEEDYSTLPLAQPGATMGPDWRQTELPDYWTRFGLKHRNGVVWVRREFDVPTTLAGQPAALNLGLIEDDDKTYINGTLVGHTNNKYVVRHYNIPAHILRPGKNALLIRVLNFGDKGGFIQGMKFGLACGDQEIPLSGSWVYKATVEVGPKPTTTAFRNHPANLYNGMIVPLKNYGIKGAVWYQGEGNSGRAHEYQALLPALINDWRKQFGQGPFPFLVVQLPNYQKAVDQPSESAWAELREAQTLALKLPNTGMAVTLGLGEWNNLHPPSKREVGQRLALAAEKVAYHDEQVVYSGPLYQSSRIVGNQVIIDFDLCGSKGLATIDHAPLSGFAIAGDDRKFVWANAKIKGDQVIVWSDTIAHPIAVRYAWATNPANANLINQEGLPASGFRTDDWQRSGAGD